MLRAIQEASYESAAHVVATCLAAHAVPEGVESATPTSRPASTRCCPRWRSGGWPTPPTSSASAARSTSSSRGAISRLRASTASPCGCTATSSPRSERSSSRSSSGRARRPPRGDRRRGRREAGRLRRRRRRAADRRDDARPPDAPARALVDAGGLLALATDFNPGSSPCDSLPAVMHLACTQCHLSPAEALSAVTVNAATCPASVSGPDGCAWASGLTSHCWTCQTGGTLPTAGAARVSST